MEFIINGIFNIGMLVGIFYLFVRAPIMKLTLCPWAIGVIFLRIFDSNYAAQAAAAFPSLTPVLIMPWAAGLPILLVLFILKKMFFKGW